MLTILKAFKIYLQKIPWLAVNYSKLENKVFNDDASQQLFGSSKVESKEESKKNQKKSI